MSYFYKCIFLEKQRHCRPVLKGKFLTSVSYSFITIRVNTVGLLVLIYISMCVSDRCVLLVIAVCYICVQGHACVTVCDTKSEYQKNIFYLEETFNERNIFMHKPHSKALQVLTFKVRQI